MGNFDEYHMIKKYLRFLNYELNSYLFITTTKKSNKHIVYRTFYWKLVRGVHMTQFI